MCKDPRKRSLGKKNSKIEAGRRATIEVTHFYMCNRKETVPLAGFLILLACLIRPVFPNPLGEQNTRIADLRDEDCVDVTLTVQPEGKLQAESDLLVRLHNRCDYPVSFRRSAAPRFYIHKKGIDEHNTVSGDVYEGLPAPIASSLTAIFQSSNEHNESIELYLDKEFDFNIQFSGIVWYSPMSSITVYQKYTEVLKETEYLLFVSVSGTSYGIDPQKEVRAVSKRFEFAYPFVETDPGPER